MTIESFPEDYHGVAGAPQAPGISPNGVPGGASPADLAAAGLGFAGNAGVPGDMASSTEADLDRRARAADAARKFPANEAEGAAQMQGVGGQQAGQMIQQVVSSITGAVGGAVGGILGPLTQLPQQAMQAGQSAMQPLMGALQQGGHGAEGLEAAEGARLADSLGGGNRWRRRRRCWWPWRRWPRRHYPDRLHGAAAGAVIVAADESCWGAVEVADGDAYGWHADYAVDGHDRYADDAAGCNGGWRRRQ